MGSSSPLSCPGREGRCALRGAKHVWRHSYLNQRNPTQHLSKEQKARLRNKLRRAWHKQIPTGSRFCRACEDQGKSTGSSTKAWLEPTHKRVGDHMEPEHN